MKTDLVKGFKDYTGKEAQKRAQIKQIMVETFEQYGFEPAETPIIEYEEFVRGENPDDETISDMYKLKDKGKRKLALRYEFTFQLKRLMEKKKLPYKRYQIGPVFRDEPASKNRFRQFTQCDIDIINSKIKDEAEILAIAKKILDKLKISFIIYVNNRKLLNEILEAKKIKKNKKKIIKELDKLDKLSKTQILKNLKKYQAENLIKIFKKPESYFERYKSYSEIKELKNYCEYYGVEVIFSPSLARGLSYYNGNIFEIKTKKIKETLVAGGSFIFNNIQSTGIAFGLDRISNIAEIKKQKEDYLIISLNQDKKAIEIAQKLRKKQKNTTIYYGKPSKALEYANAYDIQKVIFVGEKEIKQKKFKIKDMKTGKEEYISQI